MNSARLMILMFSQNVAVNIPPLLSAFRVVNDGRNRITNDGSFRIAKIT